jgi:hypothetical protein
MITYTFGEKITYTRLNGRQASVTGVIYLKMAKGFIKVIKAFMDFTLLCV